MDAKEIAMKLAENPEAVCRHLLPMGKALRGEYLVGSVHGEEGNSMRIRLTGRKAGFWSDFAVGEKGGDLLDLWQQTRGLTFVAALNEAKAWLGIREVTFTNSPSRAWARPQKPRCAAVQGDMLAYLTNVRKLTEETISAFRLGLDSQAVVFPTLRGEELLNYKRIRYELDADGRWTKKILGTAPNAERALYGWQALESAFPDAREVIITEGELDAMSGHQLGFPSLSVPFGGGAGEKQAWVENEYPHLERFSAIYLALDADGPGEEAAMALMGRLGRHRTKLVPLGAWKDLNEALQSGLTSDGLREMLDCAVVIGHPNLTTALDHRSEIHAEFDKRRQSRRMETLPWSKTWDKFYFSPGDMTLWTGYSGHGKSQLLGYVAVSLAERGHRIVIASPELPNRKLYARLVRQATAVASPSIGYIDVAINWLDERFITFSKDETISTADVIEAFTYAKKRYGAMHFIIDSLMTLSVKSDDYEAQKQAVIELCNFKKSENVHIHLVAHAHKQDESRIPTKSNVFGSSNIVNLVDNVISVWRDKSKERKMQANPGDRDEKDKPDVVMMVDKQREHGWEGLINLWFDTESLQYMGAKNEGLRRFVDFDLEKSK